MAETLEAGYSGRKLKLKFDELVASGTMKPLAGIEGGQSRTISRTRGEVDITSDSDDGWRRLLPTAATKAIDLTFSGVMRSDNYEQLLQRWHARGSDERLMRVSVEHPLGFQEGGDFFMSSLETGGEHSGHTTFSTTLMSSGEIRRVYGRLFGASNSTRYQVQEIDPFTGAHTPLPGPVKDSGGISAMAQVGDNVYAILDHQLYTVSIKSGTGAQVGSTAAGFGVAENDAESMAGNETTLYMIGGDNEILYTLDLADGDATRVGNVADLGVNASNGDKAIAWHRGTLYCIGAITGAANTKRLMTINTDTSVASLLEFDLSVLGANDVRSFTSDGHTLYASASKELLWLDLDAGKAKVLTTMENAVNGMTAVSGAALNG